MMEEHQGKHCHDSSDSKPSDFGDYMSTASTISSASSDNEEQEDIVKDSGANSKVFRNFSDSEYDSEPEDICKTNFSQIPDKNSGRLEHYNAKIEVISTIRSGVVASEKDFKSELIKSLEEDLRLQTKHNARRALEKSLHNAALQSKLTEQTSLAKELAKENLRLNEELLKSRRVDCIWTKPKIEEDVKVNSLNESGVEVLDLEGVNQRNLELLYEKGKAISELIDMKAELEQEKLRNAKFLQEKDQAFTVALKNFIDMKNKNSDLRNESLKWRRKNLETEEILQEKDQALTKAFQNFIDMKAESLELNRENVQNAEIVKEKEPAHTEDMKELIEVESLMSENLKLTQEITFLNTNAHVNDLELKRMRTELEKGGQKEQEMVKLLYQKDEAITKTNSELVEVKQQNAEILKVKDLALTEASKQLIDMKAQVTIHVQEIVRNVLEINNLKEELANER